jgi:hypothetical protein
MAEGIEYDSTFVLVLKAEAATALYKVVFEKFC